MNVEIDLGVSDFAILSIREKVVTGQSLEKFKTVKRLTRILWTNKKFGKNCQRVKIIKTNDSRLFICT